MLAGMSAPRHLGWFFWPQWGQTESSFMSIKSLSPQIHDFRVHVICFLVFSSLIWIWAFLQSCIIPWLDSKHLFTVWFYYKLFAYSSYLEGLQLLPLLGDIKLDSSSHESLSSAVISKLILMIYLALYHVSRGGYQGDSIKNAKPALTSVTHLVGASLRAPKGCGFNYRSGHIPRVGLIPGRGTYGRQQIYVSHINISLSPFPSSLSKVNKGAPVAQSVSTGTYKVNKNKK